MTFPLAGGPSAAPAKAKQTVATLTKEVKELRSLMSGLEEMLTEEQFSSLGASSSLAQVVNPRLTMH